MSPVAGVLGIIALLVTLFLGMNIGFSMLTVGFVGFALLANMSGALGFLQSVPFSTGSSYALSVIPLFVLMGQFAFFSGLSEDLYKAGYKWLGRLPGGLSVATIAACAGFSAICGSSTATAATMGTVSIPEMRRYKYAPSLATGCVAAGGTLGILIPPSVGFILYGIAASQSIGKMFAAGILPGIMLAFFYMATAVIICVIKPEMGPKSEKFPLKEKFLALVGVIPMLILFIIVIGGIFAGYFTPNEGAAIGAFGSFLFLVLRKKCTWANLRDSLSSTIKTTCMIFLIMIGTNIFGYFLTRSKLPNILADWVLSINVPAMVVLICILLVYIALGCVMDSLGMVLLLVPIFLPLVQGLGMNEIWFGVLMVMVMETGLITPPVGMNVYVIGGVAKDVPLSTIFKGVFPFLIALLVAVVVIMLVPPISLWLPNMLYA